MNDHWSAGKPQYEMVQEMDKQVVKATTVDKYVNRDGMDFTITIHDINFLQNL